MYLFWHHRVSNLSSICFIPLFAVWQDQRLSRALLNCMTGALVGKVVDFTNKQTSDKAEHYYQIMATVLVDDYVAPSEKKLIREYRQQNDISDAVHQEVLAKFGWTLDEFEDGSKHTNPIMEEEANFLRMINATMALQQADNEGQKSEAAQETSPAVLDPEGESRRSPRPTPLPPIKSKAELIKHYTSARHAGRE